MQYTKHPLHVRHTASSWGYGVKPNRLALALRDLWFNQRDRKEEEEGEEGEKEAAAAKHKIMLEGKKTYYYEKK